MCGCEAQYQLKNGKWCCCKSANSCPARRKKNAIASKQQWEKVKKQGINHLKGTKTIDEQQRLKYLPKIVDVPDGYCQYGCGNLAKFTLSNGVRCCCDRYNKCPAIRQKNSDGLKRSYIQGSRCSCKERYKSLPEETKQKMNWRLNATNKQPHLHKKYFGYYKGIWCDSTWELAWVIYHLDHNIPFVRNKQGFTYNYNGSTHTYYPDFIIGNNEYVEVKGQLTARDKCKFEQFPHTLHVMCGVELKHIFTYIRQQYKCYCTSQIAKLFDQTKL